MSDQKNEMRDDLVAMVVAAYVGHHTVAPAEIASLVHDVRKAFSHPSEATPEVTEQTPAVSPKKSIHNDFLICLENGKKFKSLKRHLRTSYNMTPDQYRAKWKLPDDYPMVAPAYSKTRSALAKSAGLGQDRGKSSEAASPEVEQERGEAA